MFFVTPSPLIQTSLNAARLRAVRPPVCCSASSNPPPPLSPPNSVPSTVALATAAISNALENGHTRILINALIPGLNPALEQNFPFSLSLLNTLSKSLIINTPQLCSLPSAHLLFSSAGSAAAANAQYLRDRDQKVTDTNTDLQIPTTDDDLQIVTASFANRDSSEQRTSPHVNVIINPISSRGDPVMDDLESIVTENPQATWILFNPRLDVDRAAVGMRESARRAAFAESFVNAFYFRPLFEIQRPLLNAVERGALLFCYGQQWNVYALVDDEYVLASQLSQMPTNDGLTSIINQCEARVKLEKSEENEKPAGLDVELQNLFRRFMRKQL